MTDLGSIKKEKSISMSVPAGQGNTPGLEPLDLGNPTTRIFAIERWLILYTLKMLDDPAIEIVLWTGETLAGAKAKPRSRLTINDRGALYRLFTNPNLNFGDLYSQGRLKIDGDFLDFITTTTQAMYTAQLTAGPLKKWIGEILTKAPRANTMAGSKKNIYHHYDIGNKFYELWLDKDYSQYTCAYFARQDMTLEQAQAAKLEHVCRKLQIKPGATVVEAGCGWGGLARYMARHYDVKIRSYNISHEQIIYARERAKAEGLDGNIEYIEDDYRNIEGKYDAFVSIGMLEHVGAENYSGLGRVITRCLKESGIGLVHSIGRNRPALMNPWIEKRIFPGAYPPALKEMMNIFESNELSVLDVENLRLHYARTLEHWLERYEKNVPVMEKMFDDNFIRAWRLYLVGSIATFNIGELQLYQILFSRNQNNKIPQTRDHIYRQA
ncbi:MAG: class I SAM-dependent methyltransferase, partial [Acidiferrobacterales bacterium]